MLRITLLLCLAAGTLAQIKSLRPCPKSIAVTNFNTTAFMGRWYEAEKYITPFLLDDQCVTVDYSQNANGSITIRATGTNPLTGVETPESGLVTFTGDRSVAKFSLNFPTPPVIVNAPYSIIGTDYNNWAVAWSCGRNGVLSTRFAWVLTRTPDPSPETLEAAHDALRRSRIHTFFLMKTDQTDC